MRPFLNSAFHCNDKEPGILEMSHDSDSLVTAEFIWDTHTVTNTQTHISVLIAAIDTNLDNLLFKSESPYTHSQNGLKSPSVQTKQDVTNVEKMKPKTMESGYFLLFIITFTHL